MRIAYKKVTRDFAEYILTLSIPADARTEPFGIDMMRTSAALVVSAESLDGRPVPHREFFSLYDWNFKYEVDREASDLKHGIYCCLSKADARNFMRIRA